MDDAPAASQALTREVVPCFGRCPAAIVADPGRGPTTAARPDRALERTLPVAAASMEAFLLRRARDDPALPAAMEAGRRMFARADAADAAHDRGEAEPAGGPGRQ